MRRKTLIATAGIAPSLAVLATAAAISAQDKYTVKVPNGLASAEFRGFESCETISVSHNGGALTVILGNPVMIGLGAA